MGIEDLYQKLVNLSGPCPEICDGTIPLGGPQGTSVININSGLPTSTFPPPNVGVPILRYSLYNSLGGNYRGIINRAYWQPNQHSFSILDLTINDVQYSGITSTLSFIAPGELLIGVGTDGNNYVTNITDWLNSYLPSGFKVWDDMSVIDIPSGSTFNIKIKYENYDVVGNINTYGYNNSTGWSINNVFGWASYNLI